MKTHHLASSLFCSLLCFLLLARAPLPTYAQITTPTHPLHPPVAPLAVHVEPRVAPTANTPQALPPLKAVLIVGPIDGDEGAWTNKERVNMELAAQELEANGVTVMRFYTPHTNWDAIKAAAQGAHFLLYRGHGIFLSDMPSPDVGGLALKDQFVLPDDIRQQLQLAPNAIVMLYGCFTAGSSSLDGSISSEEAQRRVAQYADPFFDIGAAGYYANWFGDAFQQYLRSLFAGKTLGEAYEAYFDFNPASVERLAHPEHTAMAMWLDKDVWSGVVRYNNAFVGQANQTLADLFQVPAVELSQTTVTMLADDQTPTTAYQVIVESSTETSLSWQAQVTNLAETPWLQVTPASGTTGQTLTLSVDPHALPAGLHTASVRIFSTSPQYCLSEETLTIQVVKSGTVLSRVYLPTITR
ncbi:BACON domain-containing protein [Candidatus Chloroploca sp. M-50]|uniref:BACON domain-containing protein n=1 Tax=Candidatus Chloroploca mongolica TaxID=2528176 RepID=A0ABS4DBU0_9CHLR|nr:BACON domain-containing protein [Candidatus Chloroploca mongolica]MBP1466921.1 BACON domain-containing protein [Candidatus Chloroploca mongolica]